MARFTDTDGGDDRPGLDDLEPVVELLAPLDEAEDDDDEDDYPDDATEEDVDLVVALYREDGQPVAVALGVELANDLDELIAQLRAAANVDEAPLVRYVFDVFVPAGAWEGGV